MRLDEEGVATGGLTGWPHSEFRKRQLDIQFTGSGSEYFRIWIVNLLLTVLTLSLYWPFAKARKLRYFYANTLVDGQALSFHGNPKRMLRGHVLLLALALCYGLAGHFSPAAGGFAFLVMCVIWPALWRAGQQFRLGNTGWRGLRFGFEAELAPAYLAFTPLYLPLLVVALTPLITGAAPGQPMSLTGSLISGLATLALLLGLPWSLLLIKRYQHGGYRFADQRGELSLRLGPVMRLGFKASGLTLLPAFVLGLGVALLMPSMTPQNVVQGLLLLIAALGLAYLLVLAMVQPYFTARFQNLVWNATHSQELQFTSRLGFRDLLWLTLKNGLLTLITLGFYRPFAAIHTARLRLEAVSLTLDGDHETWLAEQQQIQPAAVGEFAGDFFGIDMGL